MHIDTVLYICLLQQEMERVLLATLRWDVAAVTPQDFIPHFLCTLGELRDGDAHTGDFLATLRRHSDTLVALCVCDSRFLGTPPSLVAAATLNSALRGLRAKSAGELCVMTSALATLCQTDVVSQDLSPRLERATYKNNNHFGYTLF